MKNLTNKLSYAIYIVLAVVFISCSENETTTITPHKYSIHTGQGWSEVWYYTDTFRIENGFYVFKGRSGTLYKVKEDIVTSIEEFPR